MKCFMENYPKNLRWFLRFWSVLWLYLIRNQLKIHFNIVSFFIMTTVDLGLGIPMYSDNSNQREST